MPLVLFNPLIGPYQVPPRRSRVNLGVMAIKGCSIFPKAPELLGPHHQTVQCQILDTRLEGLTPLQRCSQCILQPQATGQFIFGLIFLGEVWTFLFSYIWVKYYHCCLTTKIALALDNQRNLICHSTKKIFVLMMLLKQIFSLNPKCWQIKKALQAKTDVFWQITLNRIRVVRLMIWEVGYHQFFAITQVLLL